MATSRCLKIFIQRDYNDGTAVKFQSKFPPELEGKIDKSEFEKTIGQLNEMYAEAEALSSRTYCESCCACLTGYVLYLCMETYYEKMLKKIARFVHEQNENIYLNRGIQIIDPTERGLRVIEICLLNEPPAVAAPL